MFEQGTTGLPIDRAKYFDGPNTVELAWSMLGPVSRWSGFQAYHTSIVINSTEFFFDDTSIQSAPVRLGRPLASHVRPPVEGAPVSAAQHATLVPMGKTRHSGDELRAALRPYFGDGSYDLLRKNCNTFSDVALAYHGAYL